MEVIETGQPLDFEFRCNQDQICTHVRMTPEFDSFGALTHVLTVGRDITEIDRYRQKVHHQAFFDALTDLPNRSLLLDRIQQTIADAQYHQHQFGFMMLDLDHFKEINDSLGHSVGDALLCEVAKTLHQTVRSYDTVARLGGDEFAILLPAIRQSGDLAMIAEKILQAFINPFHLFGKEIFVSVSIGIVLYPTDSDEVDALFKYADSSMYHAKRLGRNNFQFYSKAFTERATERLMMEAALRKAALRDEFELYFQPQIELSTGKCVGAEALIRWNHAELGLVMPDKFIQIAEESGLIVDIGAWVLLTACQKIADYNSRYHSNLKLAVNLSTRQFIRNDLVSTVVNILQKTSCKPEWVELEITESLLLEDSAEVANTLLHFHEMGLAIAIDDFGTGYSALGYLNRFPVSQIKIDRSFVMDVPENVQKSELVKAILSLADALGIDVVAEGIETLEAANFLLQQGCGLGQGYYFGKPMPWSQLITFLHHE
jgi:diguanylate cyclase (GGDEF)-like protein